MPESNEQLLKLEERLRKAVEVFKKLHADRRALEQEVEKLQAEFKERAKRWDTQERDLQTLRREREDVRGRIEKLLAQIDLLTKGEGGG